MKRGDVYWVEFPPPDRRRPVVILTRNSAIGYLNALTVAPITTTIRRVPSEVPVGPEDGLPETGVVNLYNLQTVPKSRLSTLITSLSRNKMSQAESALLFALGIEASRPQR